MLNRDIFLFPFPKKLSVKGDKKLKLIPRIQIEVQNGFNDQMAIVKQSLEKVFLDTIKLDNLGQSHLTNPLIIFCKDEKLEQEAYTLEIGDHGITIGYSQANGAYYAVKTLGQLVSQYGQELPFLSIEDAPDFPVRGVMLDIGRDKIPTMESLYSLIELLADLKINQLQLYMEGYSFEFKDYKELFPEEIPITSEEYQSLDAFALRHFIDLVPTQNCFGHMGPWLATERFNDLAENPDGFDFIPGLKFPPTTLNPLDKRSEELVRNLLDDLLPNFSSDSVNLCLDEPFELGKGKSKEVCEDRGKGQVYLEFLQKVHNIAVENGKKSLVWGDILTKHPETLPQLPNDITVLDWEYEGSVSFENHCKLLKEHDVSFYVCPGTSSWGSIAGRTDNMKENIWNAAEQGLKYGARGFLITDWGDSGHWQYQPISYPGYAYGAAVAWNAEGNKDANLACYLDEYIFKDQAYKMGNMVLNLGNYLKFERAYLHNATFTFHALSTFGLCSKQEFDIRLKRFMAMIGQFIGDASFGEDLSLDYDFNGMYKLLEDSKESLSQAKMTCEKAELISKEFYNTIRLINHGSELIEYIVLEEKLEHPEKIKRLKKLENEIGEILTVYSDLWLQRNRKGGLTRSTSRFRNLRQQYSEYLHQISSHLSTYVND